MTCFLKSCAAARRVSQSRVATAIEILEREKRGSVIGIPLGRIGDVARAARMAGTALRGSYHNVRGGIEKAESVPLPEQESCELMGRERSVRRVSHLKHNTCIFSCLGWALVTFGRLPL